jgi:hypothetical protein
MPSILIQIDERTLRALNRLAPPKSRRRAEFVREAIHRAIRAAEYARMRQACRERPDSERGADTWQNAEEYR